MKCGTSKRDDYQRKGSEYSEVGGRVSKKWSGKSIAYTRNSKVDANQYGVDGSKGTPFPLLET